LNVREMLEATQKETRNYCKIEAFATAWPAEPKAAGEAGDHEGAGAAPVASASVEALEHGEHLVHSWVFWAFVVGIGLGFVMYMNGYAVADTLMKAGPLRWIHTWLYRRMYFDELYFSVFVAITIRL